MDFIFDNLIFFVMAAAGLVQWWKSTQESKAERQAEAEVEAESYEEFVEEVERRMAMNPPPLPAGGAEPRPGMGRSPVPDLRRNGKQERGATAPPLPEMGAELMRQEALAERMRELKKAKKAGNPNFEIRKKGRVERASGGGLRGRLQSRRELRDAFVLKEILEKPVGLR